MRIDRHNITETELATPSLSVRRSPGYHLHVPGETIGDRSGGGVIIEKDTPTGLIMH